MGLPTNGAVRNSALAPCGVNRQSGSGCSVGSIKLRYVANACQHAIEIFTFPLDETATNASTCSNPRNCGGSFGTRSGAFSIRPDVRPKLSNACADAFSPTLGDSKRPTS